jgi:hypothetical protein
MSSGGQRGIDVSGITGIRLQNASDFVSRVRYQKVYQTFASTTGANAYQNETPNATGSYLDFLFGRKEVGRIASDVSSSACVPCTGGTFTQVPATRSFRT